MTLGAGYECDFTTRDKLRAVSAFGVELVTEGHEFPVHNHREAQLILIMRGLLTFEVAKGLWMVPPHCALWIPGGIDHSVRAIGGLEVYALFIAPEIARDLPAERCTMSASPLLRELVMAASRLPELYDESGPAGRLVEVMLDEILAAPVERLHLPLPADPRLRKIADGLTRDPADRATIGEWAGRVAMSERALFRLVPQQTGMSFGRWRKQFQIMLALERLSEGEPVQSVALDLGYESASAFITMFKKALGQPPARYLASRRGQAAAAPSIPLS